MGFSDFVRPVGSNVFTTENHGADDDAEASTGAGAQDGSDEPSDTSHAVWPVSACGPDACPFDEPFLEWARPPPIPFLLQRSPGCTRRFRRVHSSDQRDALRIQLALCRGGSVTTVVWGG